MEAVSASGEREVLLFGPFTLDEAGRSLSRDGEAVPLTAKAFDLLALLARNAGRVVSREELMAALWPDAVVEEQNINFNVSLVRKALGDTGEPPNVFIETVRGRGYKLVVPVTRRFAEDRVIDEPGARGKPLVRRAVLTLAALAGAALVVWFASKRLPLHGARAEARSPIAVVGFQNLSSNPGEAWLGTALSEMLAAELAAGSNLRTVSAESVARARAELGLPESGSLPGDASPKVLRDLGTEYAVLGTYVVVGAAPNRQCRFDARLVRTPSGEAMATVSESGAEAELFTLVADAGEKLRSAFGVETIPAAELARVRSALPADVEAVRLYAEGLRRRRGYDVKGSVASFEAALSKAPRFALARAALSDAWAILGYDLRAVEEARRAVTAAAALSREQRLLVEGNAHRAARENDAAIDSFKTLFGFFADDLEYGLLLARAQAKGGKPKDALATVAALRKLTAPLREDPRIDLVEFDAEDALSDFAKAREAALRAEAKADARGAKLLWAQARDDEGWADVRLGDHAKAIPVLEEARRTAATAGDHALEAVCLNNQGIALVGLSDFDAALAKYDEALKIRRDLGYRFGEAATLNNVATVDTERGDLGSAAARFREAAGILHEIGRRQAEAQALGNLASVLSDEGDLVEASAINDRVLGLQRELGDRYGESSTLANQAANLKAKGDFTGARKLNEEAVAISREIGAKDRESYALQNLGELAADEGEVASARKRFAEALALREKEGRKWAAAETRLALADLALEEGKPAEAEPEMRKALGVAETEKVDRLRILAAASLARCLLVEGKAAEAAALVEKERPLAEKSLDVGERTAFAVVRAEVLAATGKVGEATTLLKDAILEAKRRRLVKGELLSRLALGEIEIRGDRPRGLRQLQGVSVDAARVGYAAIAKKARDKSAG